MGLPSRHNQGRIAAVAGQNVTVCAGSQVR
jgi:hypothetical protein